MAALIAREDLDVAADRALGHYTHEKSSVGCAAALATLDVIRDEDLLRRSCELGARGWVASDACAHPAICGARGRGLSFALELSSAAEAETIMYRCLANGLSFKVGGGNVLTFCPPLTITEVELMAALDIVDGGLPIGSDAQLSGTLRRRPNHCRMRRRRQIAMFAAG